MLKKSMQSYYDYIKTPFEIIICDQGSTFKPTIEFLEKLESDGIRIYRWQKNFNINRERNLARDNIGINENIQDYFRIYPKSNYIVTDPDIFLDNVNGDISEVYAHLLNIVPEIIAVGPMLRIDDIPDYYPLKEQLLSNSRHKEFHSRPQHTISYNKEKIGYVFAPIDTTFAMFRAETQWQRTRKGIKAIRTFAPYSAKHLDWYIDSQNLTEDQEYYMKHASTNAHWSKWD